MKKLFTILLCLAALMNTSVAKEKSDKDKKDWGYLTGSLESTNHFYVEDAGTGFTQDFNDRLRDDEWCAKNDYLKMYHFALLRERGGQI